MSTAHRLASLVTFVIVMATSITAVHAQSVRLLGDFRDWSSYATNETGGKLCFVLSKPKDVRPSPSGYTQSYLYLTHRPAEGVQNEFNFVAGYDLAPEQAPIVTIGGRSFDLFVDSDAAWLDDPALSGDVAGNMRAGSSMSIKIIAADGTEVIETFSLSGVTAASRAIDRECG